MSDLLERAKQMPSSLNDACRTIELMADEIKRLRAQLASAKDALSDWLAFAEEELPEFILDDEPCDGEALCPKCRSSGCVQDKIERTRAALTDDQRKPACEWCDNCKTEPCNGLEEARLCSRFLR